MQTVSNLQLVNIAADSSVQSPEGGLRCGCQYLHQHMSQGQDQEKKDET